MLMEEFGHDAFISEDQQDMLSTGFAVLAGEIRESRRSTRHRTRKNASAAVACARAAVEEGGHGAPSCPTFLTGSGPRGYRQPDPPTHYAGCSLAAKPRGGETTGNEHVPARLVLAVGPTYLDPIPVSLRESQHGR
jgi:hypothetical protein